MSGTGIAKGAMCRRTCYRVVLSAYVPATRCLALTHRMMVSQAVLWLVCCAICLRARYAMSGTDLVYGASRHSLKTRPPSWVSAYETAMQCPREEDRTWKGIEANGELRYLLCHVRTSRCYIHRLLYATRDTDQPTCKRGVFTQVSDAHVRSSTDTELATASKKTGLHRNSTKDLHSTSAKHLVGPASVIRTKSDKHLGPLNTAKSFHTHANIKKRVGQGVMIYAVCNHDVAIDLISQCNRFDFAGASELFPLTCYAMSGTELVYAATRRHRRVGYDGSGSSTSLRPCKAMSGTMVLCAYAHATVYPVLTWRINLHSCYAISGTDTAYGTTNLCAYYAISGTDPAYGATRCG
eukprot:2096394-Rhodomonas_salina.1